MRSDENDDDRTLPASKGGSAGEPKPVPAEQPQSAFDPTLMPSARGAKPAANKPASAASDKQLGSAPGEAPQIFAGRFEVVELLGEGGMGKVYSVRDRQIEGRAVALKVLLPKFSKNEKFRSLFFQEIRAAQNFVSEHVVQVRDCGQMDDGRLFVTMDLVSGEALRTMLSREGVLRPRHALEVARQTLLALQSGHERGFVHRDVKPANIMLAARVSKTDDNPYGVAVRVLDFGIARLAADIDDGKLAGTPMYMSPEQVQGQRLDARSDLFAVGVVLYEMLSGRRPFGGTTVNEITQSVIETNVAPMIADMKELSAPIRRILEKALQKDREKRFQSSAEFINAIEKSSAYKLPSAVPAWAWVAMVVFGGAAAAQAFMFGGDGTRVAQLEDQLRTADLKVTELSREVGLSTEKQQAQLTEKDAQIGARDTQIADLQGKITSANKELEELRSKQVAAGAKEGDEYVKLQAQLDSQSAKLESLTRDFEKAEHDKQVESQEKLRLQAQLDDQNRRATQLQDQIAELNRELGNAKQALNPAARRSASFDALLGVLERGGGAQAAQVYEQALTDRSFDRATREGTDLVAELVGAASALESFDTSRRSGAQLDVAALLDASRRLGTVKELRAGFGVAASAWLGYGQAGEATQPRLEHLDQVVTALAAKVQPEINALGTYHTEAWAVIEGAGPEQDPAAAFAHARTFSCTHTSELARACAAATSRAVERDGHLDLAALARANHIDAWGAHLGADATALSSDDARKLVLLWYARRWYDADEANDAGFDFAPLGLPQVTSETPDWRSVLALEVQLAQADSGFPIRAGRTLVFRYDDGSPLRWRVDDLAQAPQGPQGPWDLKRSQFREDAMPLGTPLNVRIARRGSMFALEGSSDPLLDLKASGDAVYAAPFPAVYAETPPPQLRVSQVGMNEHRAALERGVGPCLVYKRGALTRWFSPVYGLVLETNSTGSTQSRLELVFATPLR